jgi:hypothetical protein
MGLYTNIRIGWEGLPGANTKIYYQNLYLTAVKSFITLAPKLMRPGDLLRADV